MSVKYLIAPVSLNILFLFGTTDFLTVGGFLNVSGVCSTDGKISSAFLLKIRTGFVSHSNEVRNPCSQYFSSKYFEHVAECFIGIRCWWFPKCGLESTNQKPGLNPF